MRLCRLCRLCRLGEEEGGLSHTRILAVGGDVTTFCRLCGLWAPQPRVTGGGERGSIKLLVYTALTY